MRTIDNQKLLLNLESSVNNLIAFDSKKYLWIDTTQETILPPTTTSSAGRAYRTLGNLYTQGFFSYADPAERDDVQLVEAVINAFTTQVKNETGMEKHQIAINKLYQLKTSVQHLQKYYAHIDGLRNKYSLMEKTIDGSIDLLSQKIEHVILLQKSLSIEEKNIKEICEKAIKESQSEQVEHLLNLKNKLEQDFQKYTDPIFSEKCKKIKLQLDSTIDSLLRVNKNTKEKETLMNSFLGLNLSDINNESQYKKALNIVRAVFLELYRESSEPGNELFEKTMIHLAASSSNDITQFGKELIEYINKNLKVFHSRPTSADNLLKQERENILDQAASMLGLPEDKQGGLYLNGFQFVSHKLKAFKYLYEQELSEELKEIIEHLINQTSPKQQRITYNNFPDFVYCISKNNYENKKFPELDAKKDTRLNDLVDKFLQQLDHDPLSQKRGIIFPAGFRRHAAPFSIKQMKDDTYHLICANAGGAHTGESHQVDSIQHINVTQTKDTKNSGNGKISIGEVVTEYGPYSLLEIKMLLKKAAMLIFMQFVLNEPNENKFYLFYEYMQLEFFKSMLDPNKKLKHEILNDQTFQVLGNCFVKNIDLLVKDTIASYIIELKEKDKFKEAFEVNELLNIYHQELMVKKQTQASKMIPEKKAINLVQPNEHINFNFENFRKKGNLCGAEMTQIQSDDLNSNKKMVVNA